MTLALAPSPAWRREPYRLFFPLGAALAWAGVSHWLLFAAGWSTAWRPVFHSIVQIQGFMTCFALGFLFTAIPRRTGTASPSATEMLVGLAAPIGTTVAAHFDRLALSQVSWAVAIITLMVFAIRRFRSRDATRRPPDSFVWVPLSLAMGLSGSVLVAAFGIAGLSFEWHNLGRMLLLQGTFVGLVAGVGGMVLPLITCGDAPPDAGPGARIALRLHLVTAALLVATFVVEAFWWPATGRAARSLLTLAMLGLGARIWRRPRKSGAHRYLVWLSAWAIPVGYAVSAALPHAPQAGLHVVFIGGFALLALSVGVHVTFAHGARPERANRSPWQVPVFGGLVIAAALVRGMVNLDPVHLRVWLGAASAMFLLATLFWLWALGRALVGK